MTIKEEFEKALSQYDNVSEDDLRKAAFREGCLWMAERCAQAQHPILRDMISRTKAAENCRQLAKELS